MPGPRCTTTRRAPKSSLRLTFLSYFIEHFPIQGSGHPVIPTICTYYTIYTAQLQNMHEKPMYSSHLATLNLRSPISILYCWVLNRENILDINRPKAIPETSAKMSETLGVRPSTMNCIISVAIANKTSNPKRETSGRPG